MMTRTSAILALLVILGCTTAGNAPATAQQQQSEFKNLQVLPRTITRPELLTIMRSFNRALGVKCNHCHAPTNPPGEQPDFPSDAKEEKRVARVMIQMTSQINGAWMERVEAAEGHEPASAAATPAQPRVHCWTCHRGKTEPEIPPPPPPPADPS
jgi:Photosynthetic reaction centre cytochrome C subunit